MPGIPEPAERVARFVEQLDLRPLAEDRFCGPVMPMPARGIFGGLLLAHAVVAAARTGAHGIPASLHASFLRAGRDEEVTYAVARLRDTRSFATRRVTATQGAEIIFEATVAFTVPQEEAVSHQLPRPAAPPPDDQPYWWNSLSGENADAERRAKNDARWLSRHPVELRTAETLPQVAPPERLPHRAVWIRPVAPLPDDELIHAAALAYVSDYGIVTTVSNAYNAGAHPVQGVSLDHAVWWHRRPRLDGWVLYTTDSPAGHFGRGLAWGGIWDEAGTRVLSVAQEGFYRSRPPA